ncbi:MAG: LytTR family DNA-binding domain-containing protein [Acidobacteriia bacterium]|nr:LytTR family DNA-binding domain-containing protein [Terriglobia bacterium]
MTVEAGSEKLRVAIVDDEAPARSLLREYLSALPDVEIVAECANGFEAVKAVEEAAPALLLLDIQMPGLSGFEVLDLLGCDVAVVFVTAYDEYALRAFEVHAVDYLLKPFSPARLKEALGRARQRIGRPRQAGLEKLAASARPPGEWPNRLVARERGRVHVIPVDDLDLVEARDDYVCLRSGGREVLKQQTLTELAAQLDPARFMRVHRSFIVNVAKIARIERYAKDSRLAVLLDGTKVPISRAGYASLRDHLG